MIPTKFRRFGRNIPISYCIADCSLGWLLLAETARGICMLALGDSPQELRDELYCRFSNAAISEGEEAFADKISLVLAYVEELSLPFPLPLDVHATSFQARVWAALQKVPFGTTTTYSEVAQALGAPRSVRAVASACASNAVSLAIPCHRVVRKDGALAGYRWGVARKEVLLSRERATKVKG